MNSSDMRNEFKQNLFKDKKIARRRYDLQWWKIEGKREGDIPVVGNTTAKGTAVGKRGVEVHDLLSVQWEKAGLCKEIVSLFSIMPSVYMKNVWPLVEDQSVMGSNTSAYFGTRTSKWQFYNLHF